jgi:hypothetical protein
LPQLRIKPEQPNATSLLGGIGPHDLTIGFDCQRPPRKYELQAAQFTLDNGPDNLTAQASCADVEQDSAAIRAKSDVG